MTKTNIKKSVIKDNRKIMFRIMAIMLLVMTSIININPVNAKIPLGTISGIYDKGYLGAYLKYKGIPINEVYTATYYEGVELPAYCLDQELPGVGNSGIRTYDVEIEKIVENTGAYRAVINGHPYKTLEELGVATKEEAFYATKHAVYSMLYGYNIDDYSPVDTDTGRRTYQAYRKIVTAARNTEGGYIPGETQIVSKDQDWKVNMKNDGLEREFLAEMTHSGIANIKVNSSLTGIKIENLLGAEIAEVKNGESFKIVVPFESADKDGEIRISVSATLKTLPVFFGKTQVQNTQNYAIAGIDVGADLIFENIIPFRANNTKIVLNKKDGATELPLEGVKFELVHEGLQIKKEYVTDSEGKIEIDNVIPGEYYLIEKEALPGYSKYPEPIKLKIRFNEKTTVTVRNNKIDVKENDIKYQNVEVESNESVQNETVEIKTNTYKSDHVKINNDIKYEITKRETTNNEKVMQIQEYKENNIKLPKTGY